MLCLSLLNPPKSSLRCSDNLSPAVLDVQPASPTTTLTRDSEPSYPQQLTFACLGSRLTIVGYIDVEGSLLRVEVILSRGNFSVSMGHDFGEHISIVLELTDLENGDVRIVGVDIHLSFGVFRAQYHFVR